MNLMQVTMEMLADPFVAAAMQVLDTELGGEMSRKASVARQAGALGADVAVLVGVTGGVRGVIALTMPTETALAIAGIMMGEPVPALDEISRSAVAELGNMVAGLATVKLEQVGYVSNITPPSLVTGHNTEISTVGTERVVTVLVTSFGELSVHVALKEAV